MRKEKKITIHDVASQAGVSISSVSRYLADPKSVQPLAAYNIKTAIRELDYEPNAFARNLKRGHSNTIGVVVPHLEYFFAKVCAAISDYFYERKYVACICRTDNDGDKERFFIQELLNQRAAGLIVAPCGQNTAFLRGVAARHGRLVILDRPEDIDCDVVAADYEENACRLVGFMLRNHACDEVGMLFGAEQAASTRQCLKGARRAFAETDADLERARLFYNCHNTDNANQAVNALYESSLLGRRPALIAFGGDFLEYAFMALNRRGPEALRRVDVAGFAMRNSMDKLGLRFPCIIQNPEHAGITASELLVARISGADSPSAFHKVKSIYHLQKSDGAPGS